MTPHPHKTPTGETASLSHLYKQYNLSLQKFFMRRVRSREEAQDMTHDLLLKLARQSDIEKMENPEGYLFTAASNALKDRARHNHIATRYLSETLSTEKNIEALSPERVLISKQSLERIMLALEKLDERAREVFILHRLESMKYADIARMYGLSVSSIEKDMIRAIAHLARYAEF
ncbi:RNA polymerase sigma factor [Asticcacaulis tiandongensis]|uniref:RNA polymerase sigma factor n=1 Tax=Asticcacaulis tiandongensis TaxID=2565365 RepID=UPI0015E8436D|nr:sigma-70 family RNA polymerase sigma factor [Asticcacaulis tiandongensis]